MNEFKITLDNTYMNVIRFGSGSKNLCIISGISLCGLEGQGESVANAYSSLADEYTVYLFDRKKQLPSVYSVREMADDIWRCLNELHISRTDVYGVSQGGMIGQWLAIDHPELVNKLVICSSMCRPTDTVMKVVGQWKDAAQSHDVVNLNRLFFKQVYSKAYLKQFEAALPVLERMGTDEDCEHFLVLANAIEFFDVYDRLPEISCPVLVLGDVNDKVIGPEGSRIIAERLNCEIFMYEDYSHAVYDEAADIKERILAFLTERK